MKDYWLFRCDQCEHEFEEYIAPGFDGYVTCPACGIASWCRDIVRHHFPAGTYRIIAPAPAREAPAPARKARGHRARPRGYI